MGSPPGFFDFNEGLRQLSDLGDQLEARGRVLFESPNWKGYCLSERGPAPPSFHMVMMSKVLVIH